jgi:RNA-directed DNA polymerase
MSGVFLNENAAKEVIINFPLLKSVKDLVNLLNWIERNDIHLGLEPKPIDVEFLQLLANTRESRYTHFEIEKKSGSKREIRTPDEELKRVQRLLNYLLQLVFLPKVHYCTNGFLYGRDIVRNARPHVNKRFVLNCDIKDFFSSISFRRVKAVLELAPFRLREEREHLGFLIANLCAYQNSLPQGAPTSPLISNIVTQRLDRKLNKYCLSFKVKYSRYADDLTFSCNKDLFDEEFVEGIRKILIEENFNINEKKTRKKSNMDRQQVTGLVVNEKVNIKREYIQKVRAMLNNWEKGGLSFAKGRFRKHQPIIKKHFNFIEVVTGHVSFIGNVRGKDDKLFQKLHLQLTMLRMRVDYEFITHMGVRERLISDNLKMEKTLMDKIHDDENKFISFCTAAFHQIENLLNYYYWKRFPEIADLLEFLLANNPRFKKRHKTIDDAKNRFTKIGALDVNVLVYIFEKQFYFEAGTNASEKKFYDRRISKLREIRNDDSHRCSVIELDKEKIISNYKTLQRKKEKHYIKEKKYHILNTEELEIEFHFELLEFLEKKDYSFVRKAVKEVAEKIKADLLLNNGFKAKEVKTNTHLTELTIN